MKTPLWMLALGLLAAASPACAGHRVMTEDDLSYPGTVAMDIGHDTVDLRIVYEAQEDCWRIVSAREGVPAVARDLPGDRHLYVTVAIEKTAESCRQAHTPLTTRLKIADKPGRISVDVFFVDQRGVYQRSQRHRIQR